MIRKILFLFCSLLFSYTIQAQSFAWGIKGGLTTGYQKWENTPQGLLFKYHGAIYIESLPAGNDFALFAQAGYHIKGSAIRNQQANLGSGGVLRLPSQEFVFRNVSVILGAKQKFDFNDISKAFYSFGLRGDYTLNTNLSDFRENGFSFFPADPFVRKLNYGAYVGGGLEFALKDLVGAVVELSISPDFSFQYQQPGGLQVTNPFNFQNITLPERKIMNVVLELSVGLRLLRIVEYVD